METDVEVGGATEILGAITPAHIMYICMCIRLCIGGGGAAPLISPKLSAAALYRPLFYAKNFVK